MISILMPRWVWNKSCHRVKEPQAAPRDVEETIHPFSATYPTRAGRHGSGTSRVRRCLLLFPDSPGGTMRQSGGREWCLACPVCLETTPESLPRWSAFSGELSKKLMSTSSGLSSSWSSSTSSTLFSIHMFGLLNQTQFRLLNRLSESFCCYSELRAGQLCPPTPVKESWQLPSFACWSSVPSHE